MPFSGTQDVRAAAARAPLLRGFDTEVWELPGAEILQLTFEVVEEPALGLIPPALHPSIPPYAILSLTRYPQSPAGPFALAQVRLVARAGARPRGYLLGAYTDAATAAAELRARWGFTVDLAAISLDPRHDRIIGRVRREGNTILEMELQAPEQISGADVTYPDGLNLTRAGQNGGEKPVLIQVDPEYVFHNAQRGRPRLISFQADAWGGEGRLRCTNPIAATFTRCDTDLPKLRFALDPTVPNAQGRIRLTERPR
ncbi:MAG TPA: acetoacetate decarboxylase family protein [Candidatus Binatia bacterium]|nr:acetoacetate decarboxylase family protein [Candidatus Binatia bacterium]